MLAFVFEVLDHNYINKRKILGVMIEVRLGKKTKNRAKISDVYFFKFIIFIKEKIWGQNATKKGYIMLNYDFFLVIKLANLLGLKL